MMAVTLIHSCDEFLTIFCLRITEPVGYGDPLIAVLPSFHDIK